MLALNIEPVKYMGWKGRNKLLFADDMIVHRKYKRIGTSLVVQWLRLHTSTAGGVGSIPGWGTKIPHAMGRSQKKKKKKEFTDKLLESISEFNNQDEYMVKNQFDFHISVMYK